MRQTAREDPLGFRRKLAARRPCVGITATFPHPAMAEYLGNLGFDSVVIDAEHGPLNDETVEAFTIACQLAGCASILRILAGPAQLERYVNLGVTGIQLPRARSVADVQRVVEAIKFAPHGRRGIGNSRSGKYGLWTDGFPTLMAASNDQTVLMIQVEDQEGIAALPDMVKLDDVDAILVGELDLSAELGVPGQFDDSRVVALVDEIVRVATDAGKPIGLAANTPEQAGRAIDRGATYLLTSVSRCLASGATPLVRAVRGA